MLEICSDLDLGEKSFSAEYRAELGVQDFECDVAIVADVAGEINRSHSARTDFALDAIPVGKTEGEFADYACLIGHCEPSKWGSRRANAIRKRRQNAIRRLSDDSMR